MKKALLQRLQEARSAKTPAILVTELSSGRQNLVTAESDEGDLPLDAALLVTAREALRDDRSGVLEKAPDIFLQVFNPPLRLIIVGAVHIAQSLATLAKQVGYEVIIVDPRQAWASEARFPGLEIVDEWPDDAMRALAPDCRTAIASLSHDPKLDDPALEVVLRSEAFYIGALGSRRTHAKRLERLRAEGFSEAELQRIHGPIGLNIGAKSPAEIAISILAEMTRVLRLPPAAETVAKAS